LLDQIIHEALSESKSARASLTKSPGIIVGNLTDASLGTYLTNYSQCLLNRQIDIFDDTLLLLENNRIPSACVISRAMIETYAFAKSLGNSITKILDSKSGQDSVEACIEVILKFTNSSRIKETEQKKLSKGIFRIDGYQFTEEAKDRMLNALATSEHVMNALRAFFKEEIEHTGDKESQFEIVYDGLSEWVHPSQTSVFHNYVPETHLTPTSAGEIHLYDAARLQCIRALHFITDSERIHTWLVSLAGELTLRSGQEVNADS
jgi:hypothetical protein